MNSKTNNGPLILATAVAASVFLAGFLFGAYFLARGF